MKFLLSKFIIFYKYNFWKAERNQPIVSRNYELDSYDLSGVRPTNEMVVKSGLKIYHKNQQLSIAEHVPVISKNGLLFVFFCSRN